MADGDKKPPQSAEELLERYKAGEREFKGANLAGAHLQGAYLWRANLAGTNVINVDLDGSNLSYSKTGHDGDLLSAKWTTLKIGDKTYHRDAVERGEEVLPFGMGPRLAVIIQTVRLSGLKHDATMAVVDQLAKAGIKAELGQAGGAGSTIRLSVRSQEDAELLLHLGDGVCRLLGLGTGIENLLPAESRAATRQDVDEGLAFVAR